MINIGRVFSTSFAMLRQRFWLLVGMWAAFFAIQMAASVMLTLVTMLTSLPATAGAGAGFGDPTGLGGMGVGLIVVMVLVYAAYFVIALAQQAAMVTLASPLEEPIFGAAMNRGFKSALPFFALTVLVLLGYAGLGLAFAAVAGVAGLGDSFVGAALAAVFSLLFMPVLAYLGCRFCVLVPVVAVDQVYNPIAAIRRCWALTRGKAGRIFLALLAVGAVIMAIAAVPVFLLFGAAVSGQSASLLLGGAALVAVLIAFPLFILIMLFIPAFIAALHSEVSDGGAEALEEVFA